jgi:hypothetical protein
MCRIFPLALVLLLSILQGNVMLGRISLQHLPNPQPQAHLGPYSPRNWRSTCLAYLQLFSRPSGVHPWYCRQLFAMMLGIIHTSLTSALRPLTAIWPQNMEEGYLEQYELSAGPVKVFYKFGAPCLTFYNIRRPPLIPPTPPPPPKKLHLQDRFPSFASFFELITFQNYPIKHIV